MKFLSALTKAGSFPAFCLSLNHNDRSFISEIDLKPGIDLHAVVLYLHRAILLALSRLLAAT